MLSATTTREFEEIYRDFRPKVDRYLSALLRNTADAEDARQQVFLSIWRYDSHLTFHTSAHAFIMKVATNAGLQMLRQPDRQRQVAWLHDETETEELFAIHAGLEVASPEDILLRQEMSTLAEPVLAELENLPKKQRLALRLRHLHDCTIEEIAREIYGRVDSKTRSRVHQLLWQGAKSLRVRVLAASDKPGVHLDVAEEKEVDNQSETPYPKTWVRTDRTRGIGIDAKLDLGHGAESQRKLVGNRGLLRWPLKKT